jgi:hypothetical protein
MAFLPGCEGNYHQRPGDLISWRPRRGDTFFASPGRRQKVLRHDVIVEMATVPVDGSEVSCHDETV